MMINVTRRRVSQGRSQAPVLVHDVCRSPMFGLQLSIAFSACDISTPSPLTETSLIQCVHHLPTQRPSCKLRPLPMHDLSSTCVLLQSDIISITFHLSPHMHPHVTASAAAARPAFTAADAGGVLVLACEWALAGVDTWCGLVGVAWWVGIGLLCMLCMLCFGCGASARLVGWHWPWSASWFCSCTCLYLQR